MPSYDYDPILTYKQKNNEATDTIEKGMVVDTHGLKATAAKDFKGVALFDADSGEMVTLHCGRVPVQVTAVGGADGDHLMLSATAGVCQTAGGTDIAIGRALEAWTAAGLIDAWIFPSPVQVK